MAGGLVELGDEACCVLSSTPSPIPIPVDRISIPNNIPQRSRLRLDSFETCTCLLSTSFRYGGLLLGMDSGSLELQVTSSPSIAALCTSVSDRSDCCSQDHAFTCKPSDKYSCGAYTLWSTSGAYLPRLEREGFVGAELSTLEVPAIVWTKSLFC